MDVLKNVYVSPVIPTERSEWRDLVQNSEPFLTRQRRLYSDALARKISPLGGLSALLGRNDRGRPVRLRGSAAPPRSAQGDRVGGSPCHPELVVTRLCCQHFAVWQNARLARRLLLFPKISLRCDFREPYKMRVEGSQSKCKM